MDKENKQKIIFDITFSLNILESVFLPFILLAAVAIGFSSISWMWTLIICAFVLWCGSGITANIIAGRNPKKLWYASIAPFAFLLPACLFASGSESSDKWLIILMAFIWDLVMCFVPFLISMLYQRKRNNNIVYYNETNMKEDNETI